MVKAEWIDPEVRGAVEELNRLGYETVSSCAGHFGEEEEEPQGLILFARKYPHRKIREVLDAFGIEVASIEDFRNPWHPKPRTLVSFYSLGGPSIEVQISEPKTKRLPSKAEAINYFLQQGASREFAEGAAEWMGYRGVEWKKQVGG